MKPKPKSRIGMYYVTDIEHEVIADGEKYSTVRNTAGQEFLVDNEFLDREAEPKRTKPYLVKR